MGSWSKRRGCGGRRLGRLSRTSAGSCVALHQGAFRWPRLWTAEEWLPYVDVFEREGKIVVRADVPGIKREDIQVSVEGDMLTIKGRREKEKGVKEEDYYCCERSTGEFSRTIRQAEGVGVEAVEAKYENGVLEVTVPKPATPERQATNVTVK